MIQTDSTFWAFFLPSLGKFTWRYSSCDFHRIQLFDQHLQEWLVLCFCCGEWRFVFSEMLWNFMLALSMEHGSNITNTVQTVFDYYNCGACVGEIKFADLETLLTGIFCGFHFSSTLVCDWVSSQNCWPNHRIFLRLFRDYYKGKLCCSVWGMT